MVRQAAREAMFFDVVFRRRLYAPPLRGMAVPACKSGGSERNKEERWCKEASDKRKERGERRSTKKIEGMSNMDSKTRAVREEAGGSVQDEADDQQANRGELSGHGSGDTDDVKDRGGQVVATDRSRVDLVKSPSGGMMQSGPVNGVQHLELEIRRRNEPRKLVPVRVPDQLFSRERGEESSGEER
eukprot:751898-Hanusia_phi.AAC.1